MEKKLFLFFYRRRKLDLKIKSLAYAKKYGD
jgi:hypothetical protein